jgi:hypothetical protein
MARSLRWARANIEYADSASASNGHIWEGPSVDEGETVTRIHLSWSAHHVADSAAEGALLGVAFGVIMGENGWTAGDVPNPWDFPNADWMYYETGWFQPTLVATDATHIFELDFAPADRGGYRDIKSQRKADAGGSSVWFCTSNSSLAPTQSRHYLSFAYSVGVLTAP